MKYLCLAYGDEKQYAALAKAELDHQELRLGGHLALLASLAPTRSAATLRPLNGKTVLCEGPFAESREPVGGFFILEARDLNEAIQAASRHPAARLGEKMGCAVEIRRIDSYEVTGAFRP